MLGLCLAFLSWSLGNISWTSVWMDVYRGSILWWEIDEAIRNLQDPQLARERLSCWSHVFLAYSSTQEPGGLIIIYFILNLATKTMNGLTDNQQYYRYHLYRIDLDNDSKGVFSLVLQFSWFFWSGPKKKKGI